MVGNGKLLRSRNGTESLSIQEAVPSLARASSNSNGHSTGPPDLAAVKRAWMFRFYDGTTRKRSADVTKQLDDVATPKGTPFRGETLSTTPERLQRHMAVMLRERLPRDPNMAIRILLAKLANRSDEVAEREKVAAAEKLERTAGAPRGSRTPERLGLILQRAGAPA